MRLLILGLRGLVWVKNWDSHAATHYVSGWRDRNPFGDRGPINVAGIEVVVTIPYSGDQSLWKHRPNQ